MGHVLGAGEVGWGDSGGGHERSAQDARCIYHHFASVAELGEKGRVELVGGGGHASVDGDDPVVVVGHGEGDFAIVVDDGVAEDDHSRAALGALPDVVDVPVVGEAALALVVSGVARVHYPVLKGVLAYPYRLEQVWKGCSHCPDFPY